MRPRYTASSQAAAETQRRLENSKKDITHERTDIAGFTLLFKDQETERKWRFAGSPKRTQMTGRFLFMSGLYQALFFMADVNDNGNSIFFKGCWRLACGLACLTLCFLVSTSLVVPSQIMLFYVQLLYGGLSLFLHFLGREHLGIWDFLILVYGLCFFMLPKISPLNFIHSCMGSAILCAGYIYISAFWLYGQQWMLSTIFLLVIAVLFMYISYSAEKSSRERWLLRERLNREHIDLQLVASSLQGDMAAAARYRSGGNGLGGRMSDRAGGRSSGPVALSGIGKAAASQTERMNNFFKGIAAWAICMSMGYAFQVIGADADPPGMKSNSKAFALLMHSMGFSIFLLYFTGQMRWFVINGVVGMLMLWIFNETGLDNRWAVISTHSIGYFILALVVVSSILVFGGVVLVWSQLIEFLMNIMNRYPEVKDEIRQERILEQVLVRYLADMPNATVLHRQGTLEDEEAGGCAAEAMGPADCCERAVEAGTIADPAVVAASSSDDCLSAQADRWNSDSPPSSSSGNKKLSRVLEAKKPNSCFFCSKNEPMYLLPACSGWTPRGRRGEESLPMCTPYSELAHTRDALNTKVLDLTKSLHTATSENSRLCAQLASSEESQQQLRDNSNAEISALKRQISDGEKRLEEEMNRRDKDIDNIIAQHNTQLSEVKRLYKKLQARQRQFLAKHEAPVYRESKDECEDPTPALVIASSLERDNTTRVRPERGAPYNSALPVEKRVSGIDSGPGSQGSDDAIGVWNGELTDMQRDFDRLWLESFEEVQSLLQSTVPVTRRGEGGHPASDPGRMKYAVHLTEDSS